MWNASEQQENVGLKIAIVGGGIVGLSCAVHLARANHRVEVFETSSVRNAASWGNAGHIATEQVAPLASPGNLRSVTSRLFSRGGALALPPRMAGTWLPFAAEMAASSTSRRFAAGKRALEPLLAESLPAWRRLGALIGDVALVREDGHYVAWETPAKAAAGRASWRAATIGTASLRDARADEITAIGALTERPVAGAIRFAGTGQIADLDRLADALEETLIASGGRITRRAAAVICSSTRAEIPGVEADLILVTAGVASGAMLHGFGHRAPIIAERGYHIRGTSTRWPIDMPPIVFEDRSMIVTRYDDRIQAASFVELGTPDAPPDPRKWDRLLRHVRELGLPIEGPYTLWMGARPTLPDYLPAIGRSRRTGNLLYAFGHQHLGLTLAPITGEIVHALVEGRQPDVDIGPFDLERFGGKGGRK